MSDLLGGKREILKELIKQLHAGVSPDKVEKEFKEALEGVGPVEIAQIEEELIKEGMPREEIRRLCDVHLAVFRESLEKEKTLAPAGHPIHILMEEHKMLLEFAGELRGVAKAIKTAEDSDSFSEAIKQLSQVAGHFKESESHYLREENVLFPYLEKHGVTQPPAIMWMEHDNIREIEKTLYGAIDTPESMAFQDFVKQMEEVTLSLAEMLSSHFYKENNVLFPTALRVVEESEWGDIRREFDEIGYCSFTPESARIAFAEGMETPVSGPEIEDTVSFETGTLSKEVVEAIFNSLPVDITFVDKDDIVRYFSQSKERIFLRTKAVIGRKVEQCHPQKSIHLVNQILGDFKSGKRDAAEFWIDSDGRLIYIRYFPVRNKNGEYLGCIEVSQDITDIKKIEGEKRLL
jgi:PAS domain S-box-containing protein